MDEIMENLTRSTPLLQVRQKIGIFVSHGVGYGKFSILTYCGKLENVVGLRHGKINLFHNRFLEFPQVEIEEYCGILRSFPFFP